MRRTALRRLALPALCLAAGTGAACALALPYEEADVLPPEATTTYEERSLNHQAPLTIEHPPTGPGGQGRAAMAGFCHEGGTVVRRAGNGQPVVRQREVCDNVAPRTLWPGQTETRPAWPADRFESRTSIRARY